MNDKNIASVKKRKFHSPISWPLLKESFRSNWLSVLVSGLANAIICIVLVLILSTLDLSSTQQSLKLLFSNADMLSLLSQGSIAMDSAYLSAVELYRYPLRIVSEEEDSVGSILALSFDAADTLDENAALSNLADRLVFDPYYEAYSQASGTDQKKHEAAVDSVLSDFQSIEELIFLLFPDLPQEAKPLLPEYLSALLESYHEGLVENPGLYPDSFSRGDTMREGTGLFLAELFDADEDSKEEIEALYLDLEALPRTEPDRLAMSFFEGLFPILAPDGMEDEAKNLILSIHEGKKENETAFQENTVLGEDGVGYRDRVVIDALVPFYESLIGEIGVLFFLDDFRVDYLTDELGRPYVLNDKGEREIATTYQPERMIPIAEGMGKTSTILHKRNKELLTGMGYTDDEIASAKKEAQDKAAVFSRFLDEFLSDYAKELLNGVDPYYTLSSSFLLQGEAKESAIREKAIEDLLAEGEEIILSVFEVSDLSEISEDRQGVSGTSLMTLCENEACGAIESFSRYRRQSDRTMSEEDSFLLALSKASQGILDELPVHVQESIQELSEMNMYGILMGILFFGLAGLLIPIVTTILLSNELLANKVETGSMAFTLSAPIKRSKVVFTQATFLILCETFLSLLLLSATMLSRLIGIAIGGEDFTAMLPIPMLLKFVLGNYLVMLSISGICFLSSAIFNKSKLAIACGGGIAIFFLVAAILGLFGGPAMPSTIRIDSMDFFNYLTIISFYDAESAISGAVGYWYRLIGLLAIIPITYTASFFVFDKKDLPI